VKVLVFGEDKNSLLEGLTVTSILGDWTVYAITFSRKGEVEEILDYVDKLYIVEDEFNPDLAFKILTSIYEAEKPSIVTSLSTKNNIDILARLAGKYDLPMSTEILSLKVEGEEATVERVILGGRAISVEKMKLPLVTTIAYKKFEPPKPRGKKGEIVEVKEAKEVQVKLLEKKVKEKSAIDIEAAEVVIGVGRGFRKKEDLEIAYKLAEILGGQVGCTRPIAADYGWLPEDLWIGITGKKVRAKLYIAIGISGAPQHISTALDSKVIVAINKDKNAPIFQYADYGVVADLYKFLPALIKKIKERIKG